LTQEDLAERIGASVQTVRRMEAGHAGTAMVHLARALQVFGELDKFNQLLDTPQDTIGLMLMDEKLPQRVRRSIKQLIFCKFHEQVLSCCANEPNQGFMVR
jgi:transcriptional regulator with XRE-family HTH domain